MSELEVSVMIGSNVDDRVQRVTAAIRRVYELLDDVEVSRTVSSPDYTGRGADYLNVVMCGRLNSCGDLGTTHARLASFSSELSRIEREMGRNRCVPEIVEIDIDPVAFREDGRVSVISISEYESEIYRLLVPEHWIVDVDAVNS